MRLRIMRVNGPAVWRIHCRLQPWRGKAPFDDMYLNLHSQRPRIMARFFRRHPVVHAIVLMVKR